MAQVKDDPVTPEPEEEIVIEDDEILVEEAPTSEAPTATATLTDEKVSSPLGGERVIYRDAPIAPKPRSNRVVGGLLALGGVVAFGLLYAAGAAVVIPLLGAPYSERGFEAFIRDAAFWVPVLFFALAFVGLTILLNRATWWLHVLSSLLVAIVVALGTAGVLTLLGTASFSQLLLSPVVIGAAVAAREVAIWVGLLISRRGVRLTARNRADREAFDAEHGTNGTAARP